MQTSAKKLTRKTTKELTERFATLLADLDSVELANTFLAAFLTKTELSVLTKRLAIIWMLHQGNSYEVIADQLNVSSATISAVSELKGQAEFAPILSLLEQDQALESFLARLTPQKSASRPQPKGTT